MRSGGCKRIYQGRSKLLSGKPGRTEIVSFDDQSALSAIRKLAMEAADNGLMPPNIAAAISRVKGAKRAGIRTGHWLTREQAENLISAPNATDESKVSGIERYSPF